MPIQVKDSLIRRLKHLSRIGLVVVALITGAGAVAPALSHEVRPAIATVDFGENTRFELNLSLNLEALIAGIGPSHEDTSKSENAAKYDDLRRLTAPALQREMQALEQRLVDGINLTFSGSRTPLTIIKRKIPDVGHLSLARVSEITLTGVMPPGADVMTWQLDAGYGDSVIRARRHGDDQMFFSRYIKAGAASEPIALINLTPQAASAVFINYVTIGYTHIVPKGLDHILFVIGLFLLSSSLRSLVVQITAFTVAHSLTLGLAMLGIIHVPASIVEPLIAASIVYVAVENVLTSQLQRWRPFVVFGFGLLHGLGFAGVLSKIGLSPLHFGAALIGFNVGVELGQLSVIAGCFLIVGLWFRTKSWYRSGITVPASMLIALIAAYWFVERAFA